MQMTMKIECYSEMVVMSTTVGSASTSTSTSSSSSVSSSASPPIVLLLPLLLLVLPLLPPLLFLLLLLRLRLRLLQLLLLLLQLLLLTLRVRMFVGNPIQTRGQEMLSSGYAQLCPLTTAWRVAVPTQCNYRVDLCWYGLARRSVWHERLPSHWLPSSKRLPSHPDSVLYWSLLAPSWRGGCGHQHLLVTASMLSVCDRLVTSIHDEDRIQRTRQQNKR